MEIRTKSTNISGLLSLSPSSNIEIAFSLSPQSIIDLYEELLDKNKIRVIKHQGKNFRSSGHLLLCNLFGLDEEKRNEVILKLADKGISTNVHYKPLPMFTAYKKIGFDINDYPNAYNKYSNEITLPLYTLLNNEDIEYVAAKINEILN